MSANFNPVLPCEAVRLVQADITLPQQEIPAEIISAVWKNKEKEKEIQLSAIEKTACIEVKTKGFKNDDTLTIEVRENQKDAKVLQSIEMKVNGNECITETEGSKAVVIKKDWIGKELIIGVSSDETEAFQGKTLMVICCEAAIGKNSEHNESELIQEINIRLSGFAEKGVPLPEKKFTEATENAVKQFQRDYMKVEQTGVVCKDFLEKLDEFCETYYVKFETDTQFNVKCPCLTTTKTEGKEHKCTDGFGSGRASLANPQKSGPEKPGIHRSLLWAVSAMKFYLDKVETSDGITFNRFSSAYRCIADNIRQERNSTNHMGNAVDIKFSGSAGNDRTRADKARELFAIYCGAQIRWTVYDRFSMEPSIASYYNTKKEKRDDPKNPGKKIEVDVRTTDEFIATTWVHIDCREFNKDDYKKDIFYCKTEATLRGSSFIKDNLIETSDAGTYKEIKNCTHKPQEKDKRARTEQLWLGMIKDAYLLNFLNGTHDSGKKWEVKHTAIPARGKTNLEEPKIQEVVTILEENDTQYKIIPRGYPDAGWIDKKYIKQICKYEKEE